MDNREAKFILTAYRPRGQDAGELRFAEALEQARRDPILQRWFEDSVAFDSAMTDKLRAVPPPANLRENILTGARISQLSLRWNRFRKWAVAAVLMLSTTLAALIWLNTRPARLAGWQTQALDVISSLVRMESNFDAQSNQPGELVTWLRSNDAPAAQRLPDNLGKLSSLGCKTFSWNGIPVSVICFTRPGGGLIHLVTMNASAGTNRTHEGKPELNQRGGWATATWREGDIIYMLALQGSCDQLRTYLL
jgi:hypothetical protein